MNYQKPELRDQLASEYVLGLLTGQAKKRMERLIVEDPAYRKAVDQQSRLHQIVELMPTVTPSDDVWQTIASRTQHANVRQLQSSEAKPVSGNLWRNWAIAASLLAVVLTGFLAISTSRPAAQHHYVIVITDDAMSRASWVIAADPARSQFRVRSIATQTLPPERVFQLWMKVSGEQQVRSVGLIPAAGDITLSLEEALSGKLIDAEKFGVSVEPPGGSPTGQPTTTPLYHGQLMRI